MNDETNEIYEGEDNSDIWSVEEAIDTNGDGIADAFISGIDVDGDGIIDMESIAMDLDGDGMIDMESITIDFDGDGLYDEFITDVDTNGDGMVDMETIESDTNGDGMIDRIAYAEDYDFDGNADIISIEADENYDGLVDYKDVSHITMDEDGNVTELHSIAMDTDFDGQYDTYDTVVNEIPAEDDFIYEEPVEEETVYEEPVVDEETVYVEPEETIPPVYEETEEEISYEETEEDFDFDEETDEIDNPIDLIYSDDLNDDGQADVMVSEIDVDGDGVSDGLVYAEDLDFDGKADVLYAQLDTDGDGDVDTEAISFISYNEDGTAEEYFAVAQDLDDDGVMEDVQFGSNEITAEEAEGIDIFGLLSGDAQYETDDTVDFDDVDVETEPEESIPEDLYEESDYEYVDDGDIVLPTIPYDDTDDNGTFAEELDNFDPADADQDGVMGDPEEALDFWEFQGNTYRCAVYSQKFVIEEYLDREVSIEELVEVATENEWFDENYGTPIAYMDKLLDYYGVPNEVSYDNTIEDLADSLNDGHRVIVSVDADEYWFGENDDDMYVPGDGVNHAIEVIGIDASDPDNVVVIVNDSGTPNGQGLEIPVETFMDAWEDGNCHMVEC